jgi:hypothetical protein
MQSAFSWSKPGGRRATRARPESARSGRPARHARDRQDEIQAYLSGSLVQQLEK